MTQDKGADNATGFVLYGHPRSGNAYKTALMLSLTGTPYEFSAVDLPGGGNLQPAFRNLNPLGKVPVLTHGDIVLRQSHDTLRYLAEHTGQFGPKDWREEARIGDWIGFAVDFLAYGVARLRFENLFAGGAGPVFDHFKIAADRGLGIIEPHLGGNAWLACGRPTIADIAVFPVTNYLADAGYDPADFPHLQGWMERFRALPGFAAPLELMPADNWPPANQGA